MTSEDFILVYCGHCSDGPSRNAVNSIFTEYNKLK